MDSLTQIVLGASIGEACLGRKIGNKALFWGAVAGTIPDLDVFMSIFVDDVTAQEMHRGFSHSIVFAVLGALLFGWIHSRIFSKSLANQWEWRKFYFWTLVTHPLLDCHTNYGTQLFWPLKYRVAYNNIFVVDPLYTLPFLLLMIVVLCLNRDNPWRSRINITGLALSTAYLAFTLTSKWYSLPKFESNFQRVEEPIERIVTSNSAFNSLLWLGISETPNAYWVGDYCVLDKNDSIPLQRIEKNWPLRSKLARNPDFQRLQFISNGFFVVWEKRDTLYWGDLRFRPMLLDPSNFQLVYTYRFDSVDAKPVRIDPQGARASMGKEISYLGMRLKGLRNQEKNR